MYRPTPTRLALGLGFLVTLVVFALSTCGGGQEQAGRPRPLPEDEQVLRPGKYRSEEFEPSLSFRVGKGWSSTPLEASDLLHIMRGETAGLGFANIQDVYEPTGTASTNIVDVPKDLVGWYRRHPYLRTSTPEPVTVGGVKGVRFDVVVDDLPEDNYDMCGSDCVDIARVTGGFPPLAIWVDEKVRVIVLEKVKGETVTIGFGSPAAEFDMFATEAQKVLDTVKWTSS